VIFAAGVLLSAVGFITPMLITGKMSANVIGGADAPTYWRLFFNEWKGIFPCLTLLGSAMAISGLFSLIFFKTVQTACPVKTSAMALALSGVGGVGLGCLAVWFSIVAFQDMDRYPIEYPASIAVGMVSFGVFVALTALYFKERKKVWFAKGLVLDVALSILFLPACFWFFTFFYGLIG